MAVIILNLFMIARFEVLDGLIFEKFNNPMLSVNLSIILQAATV